MDYLLAMVMAIGFVAFGYGLVMAENRLAALEKEMRTMRDALAPPAAEEPPKPRLLAPVDRTPKFYRRPH